MKKRLAAVLAVFALSAGIAAPAASAQPEQNGLVNVFVNDVIDINHTNVGIGVGANVAAQICGVQAQVGVLASQFARNGAASCTSNQGTEVTLEQIQ